MLTSCSASLRATAASAPGLLASIKTATLCSAQSGSAVGADDAEELVLRDAEVDRLEDRRAVQRHVDVPNLDRRGAGLC